MYFTQDTIPRINETILWRMWLRSHRTQCSLYPQPVRRVSPAQDISPAAGWKVHSIRYRDRHGMSPRYITHLPLCWAFRFPWHLQQIYWTNGFTGRAPGCSAALLVVECNGSTGLLF